MGLEYNIKANAKLCGYLKPRNNFEKLLDKCDDMVYDNHEISS